MPTKTLQEARDKGPERSPKSTLCDVDQHRDKRTHSEQAIFPSTLQLAKLMCTRNTHKVGKQLRLKRVGKECFLPQKLLTMCKQGPRSFLASKRMNETWGCNQQPLVHDRDGSVAPMKFSTFLHVIVWFPLLIHQVIWGCVYFAVCHFALNSCRHHQTAS